jgi:translation initiation factor IF-1
MAKEDLLTLEGQIDEILPDGRFGVMLENDHRIITTLPAGCANIASVRL